MAKLVRDRIPQIIKSSGDEPSIHIASDDEYQSSLVAKLQEEVDEYAESHEPAELIDIIEVVYALAMQQHITPEQLEVLRHKKLELRGGFKKRIILDNVLTKD